MSDELERLRVAQWVLERNLGWIAASEVKAGVVVAIDTAMFGALATAFSTLQPAERTAWGNLLSISAAACLAIGLFCIAMSVLPRLNGPKSSHLFFGCICKNSHADFEQSFVTSSVNDLLSDCIAQIHRNAEIARDKFRWVRSGMVWSFAAILPWVAALAVFVKK